MNWLCFRIPIAVLILSLLLGCGESGPGTDFAPVDQPSGSGDRATPQSTSVALVIALPSRVGVRRAGETGAKTLLPVPPAITEVCATITGSGPNLPLNDGQPICEPVLPGAPSVTLSIEGVPSQVQLLVTVMASAGEDDLMVGSGTITLTEGAAASLPIQMLPADGQDTPEVVSLSPVDGAADVSTTTPIIATFNKCMQGESLSDAFSVAAAGVSLPGDVSCGTTCTSATFIPLLGALPPDSVINVTITTAAVGCARRHLPVSVSSIFSTAPPRPMQEPEPMEPEPMEPDLSPAQITTVSPFAGATNIAVGTTIQVFFDANVDSSTINATNFTVISINGQATGTVSCNTPSCNTATFTPSSDLSLATAYTVILKGILSSDGTPVVPFSWTFITEATSPLSYTTVNNGIVLRDSTGSVPQLVTSVTGTTATLAAVASRNSGSITVVTPFAVINGTLSNTVPFSFTLCLSTGLGSITCSTTDLRSITVTLSKLTLTPAGTNVIVSIPSDSHVNVTGTDEFGGLVPTVATLLLPGAIFTTSATAPHELTFNPNALITALRAAGRTQFDTLTQGGNFLAYTMIPGVTTFFRSSGVALTCAQADVTSNACLSVTLLRGPLTLL